MATPEPRPVLPYESPSPRRRWWVIGATVFALLMLIVLATYVTVQRERAARPALEAERAFRAEQAARAARREAESRQMPRDAADSQPADTK
jgi:hypothetical protein